MEILAYLIPIMSNEKTKLVFILQDYDEKLPDSIEF